MKNPILVWRFEDAPEQYQKLSPHGGDEDWIAVIPPDVTDAYIAWMDEGTPFGCCDVEEIKLEGGIRVRIGAHA